MSYGALAALGALTAAIPHRWRPAWIAWWLSAGAAAAVVGGEFTNVGHTVALMLGVLVASRFRGEMHWTPVRCLMLAGSAGFGFLILAHSWWSMGAALGFGLLGAGAAYVCIPRRSARNSAPEEELTSPLPVLSL